MANGLDKLERLFSTKKKSASSRHTAESSASASVSVQYGSAFDTFEVSQALQWQLQPGSPPCQFPPTPFIRPKANAMQPRNELKLSSPHSVARTNSTSSRSQRLSTAFTLTSNTQDTMNDKWRQSTYSTTASFHIPSRTSSLLSRRHDRIPGGLIQLQLPRDTVAADDSTRPSLFPDASVFPLKQEQKGLLEALPIYPATRVETPPPSDQDEFKFPSPPGRGRKAPTALTQLTPEPSPDMIPRRDSLLSESKSSSEIKRETASAPPSRRITASSIPLLEDDWRDSYVYEPPLESISPSKKTVVHEPPVEDFLALTDEDLAEIKIEHPSKPPSRRAPPPPVLPPRARPRSSTSAVRSPPPAPVSPALASSAVVAWEAARIAKKFDFDVVYVANFWPSRMNHLHRPRKSTTATTTTTTAMTPTSASTPSSAVSSANSSFSHSFPSSMLSSPASEHNTAITTITRNSTPRTSLQGGSGGAVPAQPPSDIFASSPPPPAPAPPPITTAITDSCCGPPDSGAARSGGGAMSGTLLAGYGLETIAAPFRLSARVHKKILRTEGWIEHRKSDAKENEFARGYARSFYTGSALAVPSSPGGASVAAAAAAACATGLRRSSAPDVSTTTHQQKGTAARDGKGHHHHHHQSCKGSKKDINRGIVFVAYRRPCGPGGTVHSSAAELGALEKEAETLVELILDFHKERRRLEMLQEMKRSTR